MPLSVQDRFAEWQATPTVDGMLVETLELFGSALPAPVMLCNHRMDPLEATDENGITKIYQPIAMEFSKPSLRPSTEFSMTVRLDGAHGTALSIFSGLKPDDLRSVLWGAVRWYVDPLILDRPVWPAALLMRVESAKIGWDAIELSMVGGRLPVKRAGTYYTIERFPGLRPF